ncbi:MAG: hypothetical protein DWQ07_16485 [Chloroflexi bacterium]|nr:MAG: hypothetical protein DWQ07_16485 [Chloroflexota bacterium]MBL1195351.1 hypothetical protein [Chloroflexota bacterium]NOH12635.1 hypothetical protein [Chloroflexota bacterium]
MKLSYPALMVTLFLASMACNATPDVFAATLQSLDSTATLVASPVIPPTETPLPPAPPTETTETLETAPTEAPPPTPISQAFACVPPAAHEQLQPTVFENYPNAILDYLNAGGTAEELAVDMEALGINNPPPLPDTAPITAASADFTGDGLLDIAVSFINAEVQSATPPGMLVIYTCSTNIYSISHLEISSESNGAPAIVSSIDLNNDLLADVIYSNTNCGASTCFQSVQILTWNGEFFEPRLEGSTNELPYPDIQLVDYDQDMIYSLEIVSGGSGSVGAGPQRPVMQTWDHNSETGLWQAGEQTLGPSDFRIHLIHDADDAARRGEYEIALLLYEQAVNSDELRDWSNHTEERRTLSAYARFKMVALNTFLENEGQAQQVLQQMQQTYLSNQPQFVFVQMAEEFLLGYFEGGTDLGCTAAHVYAAQNADRVLVPLGPVIYGYTNREYSPIDICP